ncbi:hypothetical protein pb186bvf_012625 [Paramecium bursaria]
MNHVTLSLDVLSQMENFPKDPKGDFCLTHGTKEYKLSKQLLSNYSPYFKEEFDDNDKQFTQINIKYNPEICYNILKTFYGFKYTISKDGDIYLAYHICHFLQLEKYKQKIIEYWTSSINESNFTLIYQMSLYYNLQKLEERCHYNFEQNPQILHTLFDQRTIDLLRLNGKSVYQDYHNVFKPPQTIFLLNDEDFKKFLIQIRIYQNDFCPEKLFKIIKLYQDMRAEDYHKKQQKIRQSLAQFIDHESLNSRQFQLIFKAKSLQINSELYKYLIDSDALKDGEMLFDPVINEVIYLRKYIEEKEKQIEILKNQYESLLQQKDKELKVQQDQFKKLLEDYTRQKEFYENQQRLRPPVPPSIPSTSVYIDPPSYEMPIVSDANFLELQESVYEIKDHIIPPTRDSTKNQCSKGRFLFDSTPQCVFEQKEIHFLLDLFQPSIFEKINLKLLYRGSRDEHQFPFLEQNILILIRTLDTNMVFGYYDDEDHTKSFLFDVNEKKHIFCSRSIQLNDKSLLSAGSDIIIIKNFCNDPNNLLGQFNGLYPYTREFQVDELEIYKVTKVCQM